MCCCEEPAAASTRPDVAVALVVALACKVLPKIPLAVHAYCNLTASHNDDMHHERPCFWRPRELAAVTHVCMLQVPGVVQFGRAATKILDIPGHILHSLSMICFPRGLHPSPSRVEHLLPDCLGHAALRKMPMAFKLHFPASTCMKLDHGQRVLRLP